MAIDFRIFVGREVQRRKKRYGGLAVDVILFTHVPANFLAMTSHMHDPLARLGVGSIIISRVQTFNGRYNNQSPLLEEIVHLLLQVHISNDVQAPGGTNLKNGAEAKCNLYVSRLKQIEMPSSSPAAPLVSMNLPLFFFSCISIFGSPQ